MNLWSPTPTVTRDNLWKDFSASIVVFLTALPLCMGISLASGVPVEAGLITGIVGGIIVGFFSGSSFQVSGPAAGLSILVLEFIQVHGFAQLGVVLIIAGLMQVIAGWLKFGQLFRAVSPAVVNGMLSGIGLLIIIGQFYVMLDLAPKGPGIDNALGLGPVLHSLFTNSLMSIQSHHVLANTTGPNLLAGLMGLVTIAILVLWRNFAPTALKIIPAPLIAIGSVTVYAVVTHAPVHYINIPENIFACLRLPDFAAASHMGILLILQNAFALALIASAETLLSANAVDRLHKGPRCKYDRELIAQGIGNTICGFLSALPMTGVIARSSVNVHAGARTRTSAILHGLWLLLFVALLPNLLKMVPVSCLAALLVFTGIKLIDIDNIRKLYGYGKRLIIIYAATVICILTIDLLTGVMLGVGLSILKLIYTMSRLEIREVRGREMNRVSLFLSGAATFISLPKLANALERLPANCELHICLEGLDYVDHACLELLMDWKEQHESTGGVLAMDWGELQAAFKYKSRRRESRQNNEEPIELPATVA